MPTSSTVVVLVDLEVALGAHAQVEQAVARERVQEVVEEGDAGLDLGLARPVEPQLDPDVGLAGAALYRGLAVHGATPGGFVRRGAIRNPI